MANLRIAASLLVFTSIRFASADPKPQVPTPSRMAALMSAAVAVGDWRLHPVDDPQLTLNMSPLLTIDVRGVHTNRNRLETAAAVVALIGALFVASEHEGGWCRGARCDVGAAALLVAAPLLDAAARDERER